MGFAVVADEVRNLAQRCAQAASDTSSMIEDSIAKSSEGTKTVARVQQTIEAVTSNAVQVKTMVDEVSAASKEQAEGMATISSAITQMEQVTQQAAAHAEESAAAGQELSAQAEAMRSGVRKLQIMVDGDAGWNAPSRRASAPLASHHPALRKSEPKALASLNEAVSRQRGSQTFEESDFVAVGGGTDADHFPLDDHEEQA
jgi:uncharacterized phage infection (PIP) family protein YhgE